MTIRVEHLTKYFGTLAAVQDVSFVVPEGDLVALLGPSGGGKSTLLRLIAGLDTADSGSVYFGDERVDHEDARHRNVGFVFQHYALFRHMTVAQNIAFGLAVQGIPKARQRERVTELLELVGLSGYGNRFCAQLSGGQRQRVALARALAPEPRVLLLDEPFAAVDANVRAELRRHLRRLHDEMGVTSLFVTHDQDEAFEVADRIILIHQGRVEQEGTPLHIFEQPASEFVARFVGDVNVVEACIHHREASAGPLRAVIAEDVPDGTLVRLVIRSYDLKFWRDDVSGIGTVQRVIPLGDRVRVEATMDGVGDLFAHFPRRSSLLHGIEVGSRIAVEVTKARAYPVF